MYYNVSAWEKLAPDVYTSGNSVICMKKPFHLSNMAVMTGGILLLGATVLGISAYLGGEDVLILGVIGGGEAVIGLALLKSGIEGNRVREDQGGVHPKDSLYFLDREKNEVRTEKNGEVARLSSLDEAKLYVKRFQSSKNSSYAIMLSTPNTRPTPIFVTSFKAQAVKTQENIALKLSLTPSQLQK